MAGSGVTPSIRAQEDERIKVAIRATRTRSRET